MYIPIYICAYEIIHFKTYIYIPDVQFQEQLLFLQTLRHGEQLARGLLQNQLPLGH